MARDIRLTWRCCNNSSPSCCCHTSGISSRLLVIDSFIFGKFPTWGNITYEQTILFPFFYSFFFCNQFGGRRIYEITKRRFNWDLLVVAVFMRFCCELLFYSPTSALNLCTLRLLLHSYVRSSIDFASNACHNNCWQAGKCANLFEREINHEIRRFGGELCPLWTHPLWIQRFTRWPGSAMAVILLTRLQKACCSGLSRLYWFSVVNKTPLLAGLVNIHSGDR